MNEKYASKNDTTVWDMLWDNLTKEEAAELLMEYFLSVEKKIIIDELCEWVHQDTFGKIVNFKEWSQ